MNPRFYAIVECPECGCSHTIGDIQTLVSALNTKPVKKEKEEKEIPMVAKQPSSSNSCCGNCKHGRFEKTPTGRFKKDEPGRCMVEIPEIILPICCDKVEVHKKSIWPDDKGVQGVCPFWKLL